MAEQPTQETVLSTTLEVLVGKLGLTPQEVAQLRLSHLHLAGKSPNINFTPQGEEEPKTVRLDLEAHRVLVGWLVARPDSVGDFLFPGKGANPMDWQEIGQLVEEAGQVTAGSGAAELDQAPPTTEETKKEADLSSATDATMVSDSRPVPPPSTPEVGAPPPGLEATMVSPFRPPPSTVPEEDEEVSIPLPTSTPKLPPTPPSPPEYVPVDEEVETEKASAPIEETAPPVELEQKEATRVEAPSAEKLVRKRRRPVKKKGKPTAEEAARQAPPLPRWVVPVLIVVPILICVVCVSGGWLAWQSEIPQAALAGLGFSGVSPESKEEIPPEETVDLAAFETPIGSPLATPTLPPTSTPTPLPLTNTPPPTETPTPVPTDTPVLPADTPTPVDTPVPTDTPTPVPPAATAAPTDTPTPAMKYKAPVLLEPKDGFEFIKGNTIVLRWNPVGELAPDEQYAVRLVYRYQNETAYQGTNLKETEWTLPLSLYGQIDGPQNLYEWFVVVERVNNDGSGTAISPESERRTFTWK